MCCVNAVLIIVIGSCCLAAKTLMNNKFIQSECLTNHLGISYYLSHDGQPTGKTLYNGIKTAL